MGEFEGSSVKVQLQVIENIKEVTKGRTLHDSASLPIPSAYTPPIFILEAFQYTNVKCTWDEEDQKRKHLMIDANTYYQPNMTNKSKKTTDNERYANLKVYLASDHSSSDEDDDDSSQDDPKKNKASKMRALLGLSNDEDSDSDPASNASDNDDDDDETEKFKFNVSSSGKEENDDNNEKDG